MSAQHDKTASNGRIVVLPGETVTLEKTASPYRGVRTVLTVILVIIIIAMLVACGLLMSLFKPSDSGKTQAGVTWIRSIYSTGSMATKNLVRPASVSFNPGGRTFWIADAAHQRVIEFDINGRYVNMLTKYTSTEGTSTPFKYPTDIAVGPDGTLYVCEQTYNHILAMTTTGKLKFTMKVEDPTSVVAGSDMVVVGGKGGFAAFQLDGTFIGVVGGPGKTDKLFDTVSGLVMDKDENLFVVDTYNNRLSKYNKKGDRVWMVETGPPGNGGINLGHDMSSEAITKKWPSALQIPVGITIDGANRLLVIDNLDFSISAFNEKDGKFLEKWGAYGENDGQFFYPSDIAYDKATDVFVVTEPQLGRAQIIRLPGSGGTMKSSLRRILGNLPRACLVPLIFIVLLLLTLFIVTRYRRHRRDKALQKGAQEQLESRAGEAD